MIPRCAFAILAILAWGCSGPTLMPDMPDDELATLVEGEWLGVLEGPEAVLNVSIRLTKGLGGALSGILDSPDQGQTDVPFDEVKVDNNAVRMRLRRADIVITGQLLEGGNSMRVDWKQGARILPLRMDRK